MTGINIVVIPDSHAIPGHDNRRFDWVGRFIADIKPDVVVDIGDMFDMPSLSSYEGSAKKAVDGRTYAEDIEAGLDAQDRIKQPLRVAKRRLPRFIRCLGNHENRINKALAADPTLRGTIGLEDLQSDYFGWEEYPFLERVEVEGIQFSHYFPSGIMGRPIAGENAAKGLVHKNMVSCVQGHSHLFDYAVRSSTTGKRTFGLVVGCFVENVLDWAVPMSYLWHSGVVLLSNVEDGYGDLTHIGIRTLQNTYGD